MCGFFAFGLKTANSQQFISIYLFCSAYPYDCRLGGGCTIGGLVVALTRRLSIPSFIAGREE
ncbi:hypothetical protein BJF95_08060 [Rhizobium oryziradicis]|uniref:Uncharacterized protein n=1 Tax=Rhizobium oryziradicis TaxID=1867956 RepID=A0A1Q8ZR44_9HYPH|nr:hypothetical protein BJF95_08060 [Rhizobium oryziradicis]